MLTSERRWLQLIEQWMIWLAVDHSPATLRNRAHYIGALASAYVHRQPEGLDVEDLAQILVRETWQAEARKSMRSTMRSFYGWLHLTGRIPTDPSLLLPAVRVPRAVPRPVPLGAFATAVTGADARTRLILQLGRFAGMRRGEIAQVHSDDLLDDGKRLLVHGKGGHERRVPLHPVIRGQVAAAPYGWLFPGPDGHLTAGHVGKLASWALPPGWTLHTCRHRAGTDWYSVRRDIRAVQELLGHAKVSTTQLYVQIDDADLWDTVMAIPA